VCAAQIRDELCDERKWVLVSHRMAVEPSVILYWS
jgi:hypothetical protein